MTPRGLRQRILSLSANAPLTERFDGALAARGQCHQNAWWSNHQEHWLCWLKQKQDEQPNRSAKSVYNHIRCPPMLIWLPEAVGIPGQDVAAAITAALAIENRGSQSANWGSQCKAIRRLIPWGDIERRLVELALSAEGRAP